ncbi:MAG: hypothetical protein DRO94_00250 [Candidatus Altiarchaeales archaeon]|nr:MAG: hypothetical protein DRO94_00250 [Candidatus Altiarchaeales archaeon]
MRMNKILVIGISILLLSLIVNADIRIDSVSYDPSYVRPGDEVTVYLKFHNNPSTREVHTAPLIINDHIQPIQDNPEIFYKAILEPASDLSEKYIIIKDKEKNVGHLFIGESWTTPFDIKISENAEIARYKLRFSVLRTDIEGKYEEVERSYEFEIPVKGSVVFDINSNNTIKLGSIGNLKISIINTGGGNARDVVVGLDLSDPFTPVTVSSKYIGDLGSNEEKMVEFPIFVGSDAEPRVYSIPVTLEYVDDDGNEISVEREIGIEVVGEPVIGIALESSDLFSPGISGEIDVNFVNEGFVDARFVKVRLLDSEDYEILSSNEVYIGNLDSDDSETETFKIRIRENATTGIIPVKFQLFYKGPNSDVEFTRIEDVNVNVLSREEYANGIQQGSDALSYITGILFLIPVIIVAYLILWFVYKLVTLLTGYLNRRFFSRR